MVEQVRFGFIKLDFYAVQYEMDESVKSVYPEGMNVKELDRCHTIERVKFMDPICYILAHYIFRLLVCYATMYTIR